VKTDFLKIVVAFVVILLGIYGVFRFFYDPNVDNQYSQLFETRKKMSTPSYAPVKRSNHGGTSEANTRKYQGTQEDSIQKVRGNRYNTY